jgi:hypothetical protein
LIVFGVQWALIINAASFAVSFLALRSMRVPAAAGTGLVGRAGFAEVFRPASGSFAAAPCSSP